MNKKSTPLVDEHLQSIQGLQEAGTDDFFYTRLRARLLARVEEKRNLKQNWILPVKPVWVIGTLALLLTVNGFMLSRKLKTSRQKQEVSTSSIQLFAESYDQAITSSY